MLKIIKAKKLIGEINIPGDKSISHRAVMLGAIAEGETVINNFLMGEDCLATINCFKEMGIEIEMSNKGKIIIKGKGIRGVTKPKKILDVSNSGTTIRLISGILAGQEFETTITGDASIQKRPMKRIAEPLFRMGAIIEGSEGIEGVGGRRGTGEIYPPLKIKGGKLRPTEYKMPVASAQVKSCVLLAGLYADGKTTVIEPGPSRDHTERMLMHFGAKIEISGNKISVHGPASLEGGEIDVPGDISSAAFFLVAGLLVPGSDLLLRNVGMNPTRIGIIEVLHRMGAKLEIMDEEIISEEPRANIRVTSSEKRVTGIEIGGELIPKLIDEIPIIAVLATQAEGTTIIKDAKELRVKESDRIKTISTELKKMGAAIEETEDGMIITGPTKLKGATINSYRDHRVAMSMAIAGLIADGETIIEDTECIKTSFPGFEDILNRISG
ncbi:MAG: 3-phosphoshikimate 1-carboxyvinyltransferase [Candidatus Margulisiibacteriota bacterium]